MQAKEDIALAEAIAKDGIAVQVLLPEGQFRCDTQLRCAQIPPDSGPGDCDKLALALSDTLLVPEPLPASSSLLRHAHNRGMTLLRQGATQAGLSKPGKQLTHWIDPDSHEERGRLGPRAGRLEKLVLEVAAWNWRGFHESGFKETHKQIRKCFCPHDKWDHGHYFAPDGWAKLNPDRAARDEGAPIAAEFARLDRSALFGSRMHRDAIWIAFTLGAFAVFCAIAGAVVLFGPASGLLAGLIGGAHAATVAEHVAEGVWAGLELLLLVGVVLIIVALQATHLLDRWIACRYGAEQLRIARMCLPLTIVPPILSHPDDQPKSEEYQRALAEVIRAVRDQGLPDIGCELQPKAAVEWLDLIVHDQTKYHHDNHRKLHSAEKRFKLIIAGLLFIAIGAVLFHLFFCESRYLLFLTAFSPALAAALDGAVTRLGFIHRIELSRDSERRLGALHWQLRETANLTWHEIRQIAASAASSMATEATTWHSLVRRQRDDFF